MLVKGAPGFNELKAVHGSNFELHKYTSYVTMMEILGILSKNTFLKGKTLYLLVLMKINIYKHISAPWR